MEDSNKKSFFSRIKKEEPKPSKIEIEFQVEKMTLELDEVIGFAKSRIENQDLKVDEVMIIDNQANPTILDIINKECKVKVDESMSVIYLLDAFNEAVTKFLILCVDAFSDELSEELSNENHIIRLKKKKK